MFGTGGTLSISAVGSIDAQIGLFDAGFNALAGDDDSGSGLNALLSYAINAGTYYIGIGDFAMFAITASNQAWSMDGLAPAGFGAVSYIDNQTLIGTGAYTLSLSMQPLNPVPEPASLAHAGDRSGRPRHAAPQGRLNLALRAASAAAAAEAIKPAIWRALLHGQSVCANGRGRSETVTAGGRMHGTNHFNCGRLLSNAFLGTVPP